MLELKYCGELLTELMRKNNENMHYVKKIWVLS